MDAQDTLWLLIAGIVIAKWHGEANEEQVEEQRARISKKGYASTKNYAKSRVRGMLPDGRVQHLNDAGFMEHRGTLAISHH